MSYVLPVFLLATFVFGIIKRVNLFDTFADGVKDAFHLTLSILPYLATIFLAVALFRESGLSKWLGQLLSPLFALFGIPSELTEMIILRPLSGNGSLVILEDIYKSYGADSFVARAASVMMGGTDTVLYIAAVYFSQAKDKRSGKAIAVALFCGLFGTFLAVVLCRFL